MSKDCFTYRDRLVALAENPLGPEANPELLRHIEACAGCAAEYRWLQNLCSELEAFGDNIVKDVPAVDLTDSVMKAVARSKSARPSLVVLPAAPRRGLRRLAYLGATAAAAAGVVMTVWLVGHEVTRPYDQARLTGPGAAKSSTLGTSASGAMELIDPTEKLVAEMRPYDAPPADVSVQKLASLTLDDVLAARKEALNDPEARLRLTQWAELAADKARALAAQNEASLDAKVGAVDSLPPDEAERVLLAAIERKPDDPYLRYALGNLYSQQPDMMDKAASEYAAQAALDPENALSHYQLASSLLAEGDAEGAAAALDSALALAGAHPYTLEAAAHNEQALVESGMAKEVAHILTALDAGTSQYAELVALGAQLLDYGKYFEQAGDQNLALRIYQCVQQFGSQVAQSAMFSNEQLAGLDIQRDAIETLSANPTYTQSPENLQLLAGQTRQVSQELNLLGGFFSSLNDFFGRTTTPDSMQLFADYVLTNGDLGVVDFLNSRR